MPSLDWRSLAAIVWLIGPVQAEAQAESIISITLQQNRVSAAPARVHPGRIILKVTNNTGFSGRGILVLPMNNDGTGLLVKESINEDHDDITQVIGKITNIAEKSTAAATVDLKPGIYIITISGRGPYLNGMWAAFQVE